MIKNVDYWETPAWTDECNHGKEHYLGTVSNYGIGGVYKVDVYVFPEKHRGHNICIRFGNEPSEYYSPGSIDTLAMGIQAGMEVYKIALQLILFKGKFIWTRNKEK